ncbi:hypothetical protein QUF88_17960 [Bacillus sp. DX1.1]|uniref:hypothetical protein n=1 Tax=unclassified Bacillus (in: firmicutes) TaxID=185979 RepID=UPI0025704872|nr:MULTISPECIES: hypothetical protein [unclassified Bacillus (in: firmicutes)]MDM5155605.1 hypothetical protein [Bacillus sp. DX1.1]WJE79912.1 hypothetical protein QRE67_15490 [Bacillus sp. DX3.1]
MVCIKGGIKWIGACYFPRGQQTFREIKDKFSHDLEGIERNSVDGLAFITNQELTLSQRSELTKLTGYEVDIFHLERVVNLLNSPDNYGVRLEFLDIEITIEEQLAYFAERDKKYDLITSKLEKLEKIISNIDISEEGYIRESDLFEIRTIEMVSEIIEELFDEIWYDRHQVLKYKIENELETVDPEVWERALKAAKRVEDKYGEENLSPYDDFEWGMLNGKVSTTVNGNYVKKEGIKFEFNKCVFYR